MSYQVEITKTAVKERKKLGNTTRMRIDLALLNLKENSRPPGAIKLTGSQNDWRIRVGDYRILYEIDEKGRLITIWRIAHRRHVYR